MGVFHGTHEKNYDYRAGRSGRDGVLGDGWQSKCPPGQTLDLSWVQDGIRAFGFITAQPFPYLATIVGGQDAVWNLSEGELIYIRVESGKQVKAGDRLAVARVSTEVKHPVTGKKIGHNVIFPGRIVVLDGNGPIVPAKIEKSFGAINHGDLIVPLPPSPPPGSVDSDAGQTPRGNHFRCRG